MIGDHSNLTYCFSVFSQALNESLYSNMMEEILKVLERVGKKQHAEKLQVLYHEQMTHQQCGKCKVRE